MTKVTIFAENDPFFVIKQNDINLNFEHLTYKAQLAHNACLFAYMTSLASRHSLTIQNFMAS